MNDIAMNYQLHDLSFQHSMLFKGNFNQVFSSFIRNKTLNSIYYENILIDYESGPYLMFPKNERVSIFGFDFKEPAMYFLIPPFGTKKMRINTKQVDFIDISG